MGKPIPLKIKQTCCEMSKSGVSNREIYDSYFSGQFDKPQAFGSFVRSMRRWMNCLYPDETTLECGTYSGFTAHAATVQVSKTGEIVQAWIKQNASETDLDDFMEGVRELVEPYDYGSYLSESHGEASDMLEIPLFDMHWGVAFLDYYSPVLGEILDYITSRRWKRIVIPFGQDFFHNDSIVNGQTTKGTVIEKVDMIRAVKEAKTFMYAMIDQALANADEVRVLYSPGNHDRSISWMFVQVLLERYGETVVDDSLEYRKIITHGKNAIMVTHGDSKQASPKDLAQIFPISFPVEFGGSVIREVHAGHLHHEIGHDVHGVMVRRLSTGGKTDEWSNREDLIGAHKRFMLFEWGPEKLKSIHYV